MFLEFILPFQRPRTCCVHRLTSRRRVNLPYTVWRPTDRPPLPSPGSLSSSHQASSGGLSRKPSSSLHLGPCGALPRSSRGLWDGERGGEVHRISTQYPGVNVFTTRRKRTLVEDCGKGNDVGSQHPSDPSLSFHPMSRSSMRPSSAAVWGCRGHKEDLGSQGADPGLESDSCPAQPPSTPCQAHRTLHPSPLVPGV